MIAEWDQRSGMLPESDADAGMLKEAKREQKRETEGWILSFLLDFSFLPRFLFFSFSPFLFLSGNK